MPKIHFLNVNQGDCIILEHSSDRVSLFDISAGNIQIQLRNFVEHYIDPTFKSRAKGNFRMCKNPTNPLDYLEDLNVTKIWRFILSHPDMDHLDGFNALLDNFKTLNFWYSGADREKPDFKNSGRFNEEDWERYKKVITKQEIGTKCIQVQAGDKFRYANRDESDNGEGDSLYIVSPNQELIDKSNKTQEFNDASYVVLYDSEIGKVLLTGDSHDATWDYIECHFKALVSNVTLLIAPHHGRKSNRSYDFLDYVKPKLTLFGCAPSEHLGYHAWYKRNLNYITNNQCGCIVAEGNREMEIFVENDKFAAKCGGNINYTNDQGFYYLYTV